MQGFLIHAGYPAIILLAFLEACCVPISSEVIFGFAGVLAYQGHLNLALVIIIGTLAELAGSFVSYTVGRVAERPVIERAGRFLLITRRDIDRTERFLATVLENVTQAIVAKDAQDLRYVFVNRAAEKLYGLPRSEIIGKSARDLFSGEAADLIERMDRELLAGDENVDVAVQTWETPNNGRRRVSARRFRIAGDSRQ